MNHKQIKLGEVVETISNTYKFQDDQPVVFINTGDILEGKFLHSKRSNPSSLPGQAKKSIKKGDILFSEIRPANKRYALVDFDADDYVVSTKLMVLRPKNNIDPQYLYIWLTMPSTLRNFQMIAESRSGTFPQITFEAIKNEEIPYPPLSEQKRISSILSSFDNKIEQLKKENNILEDIAQSIFKEWFVKYNFPNKDGKPYKDNNGKMIDSELGLIPEGWRVGKLGEITSITSGKNLPKKDLATKGKYEVLGANGKIGETNKYLFDKQLIFTGRVGTLGNVFLSNEPAWYSDNTLLIFPKNNFLYYVYRYLQRQRLEKLDRGSTQPLITQTDLKTILLPIPSLSLLNKFEKISTLINNKITQNKNNIDYFQKIKTALLNKLILA